LAKSVCKRLIVVAIRVHKHRNALLDDLLKTALLDQASGFDYESLGVTGMGRPRTRWRDETFDDRRAVEGDKPDLSIGQRVFHQKFGYGRVLAIDGNKLDIEFEKAGPKKVLDSFIEAA